MLWNKIYISKVSRAFPCSISSFQSHLSVSVVFSCLGLLDRSRQHMEVKFFYFLPDHIHTFPPHSLESSKWVERLVENKLETLGPLSLLLFWTKIDSFYSSLSPLETPNCHKTFQHNTEFDEVHELCSFGGRSSHEAHSRRRLPNQTSRDTSPLKPG